MLALGYALASFLWLLIGLIGMISHTLSISESILAFILGCVIVIMSKQK